MKIMDSLRSALSVQGVPQRTERLKIQESFEHALRETSTLESEVTGLAERKANQRVIETGNRQNAFVTPAALATFSGASAGITSVWMALQGVFPKLGFLSENYFPFVLSLLLGVFLLYIDLSDPERGVALEKREVIVKSVITFVNCCFLTASILGLSGITGNAPVDEPAELSPVSSIARE